MTRCQHGPGPAEAEDDQTARPKATTATAPASRRGETGIPSRLPAGDGRKRKKPASWLKTWLRSSAVPEVVSPRERRAHLGQTRRLTGERTERLEPRDEHVLVA